MVGIISVATLKETARKPLEGSPPSVSTPDEAKSLARTETRTPTC